MTEFDGIVPALQQALRKRDYTALTPVQRDVLAPELADADILVSAQTGSGKTVAFGLTLAPNLLGAADRFDCELARELLLQSVSGYVPNNGVEDLVWRAERAPAAEPSKAVVTDLSSRRSGSTGT